MSGQHVSTGNPAFMCYNPVRTGRTIRSWHATPHSGLLKGLDGLEGVEHVERSETVLEGLEVLEGVEHVEEQKHPRIREYFDNIYMSTKSPMNFVFNSELIFTITFTAIYIRYSKIIILLFTFRSAVSKTPLNISIDKPLWQFAELSWRNVAVILWTPFRMSIVRQSTIFTVNNDTVMNVESDSESNISHIRIHVKIKINKSNVFSEDRHGLKT